MCATRTRPRPRASGGPLLILFALASAGCRGRAGGSDPGSGATSASSAGARAAAPASASASAAPATSAAVPSPPSEPRNVLLITVDSLRTDVPWLGYARPIAPNLSELAAKAVVYSNAYAGSSYTAKSVATFLGGRYPSTLYRDYRFFTRYAPANRFLSEVLGENGVRSFAWHGHLYFDPAKKSGFEQGFGEWRLVPGLRFDPETDNDVTSQKMTELGIELLSKPANTGGRFFGWAHYMDPHDQYQRHPDAPDFGKKARDRYDGEIHHTDRWIGKLLEHARAQPFWKNTVVIVSADHGEAFGEHGMYKHAFELWEVLTRVPLFFYGPGLAPRRIEQRRSHIDLAPTILDLMGVAVPADYQGKSLVPELLGGAPDDREPILLELAHDSHNPPRRALIQGNLKIIDFGRDKFELYDLAKDPGEIQNLASSQREDLDRMRALLAKRYETLPTVAPHGGGKLREGGRANGPTGPEAPPGGAAKP